MVFAQDDEASLQETLEAQDELKRQLEDKLKQLQNLIIVSTGATTTQPTPTRHLARRRHSALRRARSWSKLPLAATGAASDACASQDCDVDYVGLSGEQDAFFRAQAQLSKIERLEHEGQDITMKLAEVRVAYAHECKEHQLLQATHQQTQAELAILKSRSVHIRFVAVVVCMCA